jgi:hypothetical protein
VLLVDHPLGKDDGQAGVGDSTLSFPRGWCRWARQLFQAGLLGHHAERRPERGDIAEALFRAGAGGLGQDLLEILSNTVGSVQPCFLEQMPQKTSEGEDVILHAHRLTTEPLRGGELGI